MCFFCLVYIGPSKVNLFDFTRYNYCSTYNLAEGMDSKKKQKAVYSMYSDLNTITPTKKKPVIRWAHGGNTLNSFTV